MSKLRLYKFWVYNYGYPIEGLFIASKEDVDAVIGEEIYFGDVSGKHSEVWVTLGWNHVTEQKVLSITIEDLYRTFGQTVSGYDPLRYYQEQLENEEW